MAKRKRERPQPTVKRLENDDLIVYIVLLSKRPDYPVAELDIELGETLSGCGHTLPTSALQVTRG